MRGRFALLVVALVALAPTAAATPAHTAGLDAPDADGPAGTSGGDVLVVDPDGDGYDTIQAAVDAADDGDTVRVTPGTYRAAVELDANVTLVAPRGATLDGSTLEDGAFAVDPATDVDFVLAGFTVVDYGVGVWAASSTTDWVVRNTTFRGVENAVVAIYTTGDWTVRNVTAVDTGTAIEAGNAAGDWLVADTVVRNVTEGNGVEAGPSSGDWTLRNVTLVDVDFVGVDASHSTGDWRVVNSTVRGALVGVGAVDASGNWTVRGSTVANVSRSDRYDIWQPPVTEGAGIDASNTNGSWSVHGTRFVDTGVAIVADGAAPPGDATHNWFGGDGPAPDDCTGSVNCSAPLASWPPATPVPVDAPERTATPGSAESTPTTATPGGTDGPTTGPSTGAGTTTPTSPPPTQSPTPATTPLPGWLAPLALLAVALVVARRR